ncbi:hypothetical protein APASM_4117 [Actinosynnema pretiosum subsp. pretiosum]|nr:hypothetical protein APASM_4117 [Actinosynnema pretiosum subsp. pretiosum]
MKRSSALVTGPDGRPDVWLGVNFWSRVGGPLMWRRYDPDVVRAELLVMREHGVPLTRSFCYWPDFMPEEDRLDEVVLARFDHFLDLHRELGMRTIPTFLVGHMSGQNWDPPWRRGRDVFGDESFVARQRWYVRELSARWKDHPAVAGWLLGNEIPLYADERSRGVGTLDTDVVTAWADALIGEVRAAGARQPVSVGDGAWGVEVTGLDNGFRVRDLAPLVDFHGPHVYRMEDDPLRLHLAAAWVCELLDVGGRPVVLEEFGVTSDYTSDENAAHYYRQVLHNSLLAGATGWIAWNNTDFDDLADQEPYSHHPFELHFGLTTARGEPKPQLLELREFAEVLRRTDFAGLRRPDAEVALVVPSYLEKRYPFTTPEDATSVFEHGRQAYAAAREADLPVGVAREVDGVPDDCALYLLPSAKQLLAPTWRELLRRASEGAVVYASYFHGAHKVQRGSWWPDLDGMFGVAKRSRYGLVEPVVEDELRLRVVTGFGGLAVGEELVFAVGGNEHSRAFLPVDPVEAEVLAVDGRGRPALLRRRVGAGAMVLCAYPLEHMASATPSVNPEDTWRLYAALAAEAGVVPEVSVDDPGVLVSVLEHEDGRRFAWLVSQRGEPVSARVLGAGLRSFGDVVELGPYGVVVAEVER